MSAPRCCEGGTYLLPEDIHVWQVICTVCHRCLLRVRGTTEEEAYADI